jgi:large subunit ribosomal protein L18e
MKIDAEKSVVHEWLGTLSMASKGDHYPKLWGRVYRLVEVPERKRSVVNIAKIDKITKAGDNVLVPGKVLANGEMTHKVTIAAMEFSAPALKMLKDADCKVVHLKDMVKADKVHVIV